VVDSNGAYRETEAVISDATASVLAGSTGADPVVEFYTDYPYPPPVENLDRARDEWRDENRLRAEYHLVWPNKPYRDDLNILVAGCGTWQAAKYALCRPNSRVTGIDVSVTSLDHTERLKRKHGLTNLETLRLAVENADDLGRRFDLIICTGVLHHLADPDEGLRALRSVLAPDGAIYLMVYAPYGRAGVYLLQEYCRRLGIRTSTTEIRDLATVVEALPPHHSLASLLHGSRDALNHDALADVLLNPRDRSYSVPQLFDLIERNGLEFGRWYWQAPYLPQCGSIAATPHAKRLAQLSKRECYSAMELWRGTMTAHSIVVYHNDGGRREQDLFFDDDDWHKYVPLRLPSTLCVQERLPPGAAGVLLNRSHQFHDLILIIDPPEKRVFEAIDGRRSIGEILDHARVAPFDSRRLVKKLWQYDQIVFDTSKA
jgi:SAM-dependent methyltransferase